MVVRDLPPPKAKAFWRTRLNGLWPFGGQVKKMNYTYVLLFSKPAPKFYIGSTEDLEQRLLQHRSGSVATTKGASKIELVYFEGCKNKTDARKRELQLKTGFGRGYINRRLESYMKSAGLVQW